MSERTLEQLSIVAAEEARDEMAKLGIKGSTAKCKVEDKAEVTLRLPDVLAYRRNAGRIHNKEVALMEKYPTVQFNFDIEFVK